MNPSIDILLVEDDPGDVRLALSVLRALKIDERCVVVSDGEQAMDFLQGRGRYAREAQGLPRLILLDLKMPRADGFDFLGRVKRDPRLGLIPVVALTSSREERDVERAYGLGANGYVVKGIDFDDYRATLRALTEYWVRVNEPPSDTVGREALTDRPRAKGVQTSNTSTRRLALISLGLTRTRLVCAG